MRKLLKTNEFYVAVIIVVLSIVIGAVNPRFLTVLTVVDTLRSSMLMLILSMGVLVVLISGGIDVSFPAIASFSMYTTLRFLVDANYEGSVVLIYIIAAAIGILLGLINGVLVAFFRFPTIIVTLGTSSIYIGFMLTYIGSGTIANIPDSMRELSRSMLFTVQNEAGVLSSLPTTFLIPLVVVLLTHLILKYTYLGRGIYARGGDRTSAERSGIRIKAIQTFIYAYVGLLSGTGGVTHAVMMRNANPVVLVGSEMLVIAAVVLGGARITGGHGTVHGTVLGVILITLIQNNLILLGISQFWQAFVIGLLIIIGTGFTSIQRLRAQKAICEISES